MKGTFRLSIGGKGRRPILLQYDLLVTPIPKGVRLFDRETGDYAVVWDVELELAAKVGDGPTPLTAILVSHLIDQKFGLEN